MGVCYRILRSQVISIKLESRSFIINQENLGYWYDELKMCAIKTGPFPLGIFHYFHLWLIIFAEFSLDEVLVKHCSFDWIYFFKRYLKQTSSFSSNLLETSTCVFLACLYLMTGKVDESHLFFLRRPRNKYRFLDSGPSGVIQQDNQREKEIRITCFWKNRLSFSYQHDCMICTCDFASVKGRNVKGCLKKITQ